MEGAGKTEEHTVFLWRSFENLGTKCLWYSFLQCPSYSHQQHDCIKQS